MHCHWKPIKQELLGQFGGYTLAQLATTHILPSALLPGKQPVRSKTKPL
jgi:hypothetical protein